MTWHKLPDIQAANDKGRRQVAPKLRETPLLGSIDPVMTAFLRHLINRGLKGVELVISDACRGLAKSVVEYLSEAGWQRCVVHFYRNVFSHVPSTRVRDVSHMLKAIHAEQMPCSRAAEGRGGHC